MIFPLKSKVSYLADLGKIGIELRFKYRQLLLLLPIIRIFERDVPLVNKWPVDVVDGELDVWILHSHRNS